MALSSVAEETPLTHETALVASTAHERAQLGRLQKAALLGNQELQSKFGIHVAMVK
jgi:hypothetical protein